MGLSGGQGHAKDIFFGFYWFLIWLTVMVTPSHALQQRFPFAWHFITSSVTSVDPDHGSGDYLCHVPEQEQRPQSLTIHHVPDSFIPGRILPGQYDMERPVTLGPPGNVC